MVQADRLRRRAAHQQDRPARYRDITPRAPPRLSHELLYLPGRSDALSRLDPLHAPQHQRLSTHSRRR